MKDLKRSLTVENTKRIKGMLGFARRAGKTVIGTELICRAMPDKSLKLVVLSATASAATKKKLTVKSEFYGIPLVESDIDTESLGALLGKRGAVAAVAVTDSAFGDEIIKAKESE